MMNSAQRREGSGDEARDQRPDPPKRKGSPSEDRVDHQKRARALLRPADSGAIQTNREEANGKRHLDRDKRHKSKKHRHGERRTSPGSRSKSKSSSPYRDRVGRVTVDHGYSLDQEAGEIDPSRDDSRQGYEKDKSRSNYRGPSFENGPAAGRTHQQASTPSKSRPDLPKEQAKKSPLASGLGSSMLEQVRSEALRLQKKKQEEASLNAVDSPEDNLDVSLGRARGKHSPIVWNKENDSGVKRAREPTAHEIAQSELESFKRQRSDDLDKGPPAMKRSPSPSGSDHGDTLITYRSGSVSNDVAVAPGRSRWLDNDDDLQDRGAEDEDIRALNRHEQQDLELQEQLQEDTEESDDEDFSAFQRTRPPVHMLNSSRTVNEYERLNRISEGTYGVVHRARDKASGTICALKQIKMSEEKEGFPLSSIREINILLSLRHKNVVDVSEVVVGSKMDDVFMVMEYMEHDLKALMNSMSQPFTIAEAKNLMKQLLEGVAYLHDNWVLHRDLKTSNILYNNRGQLKICDFGMARQYGSPLKPYTHNVVTLLYRSIELLLGQKTYSTAVDTWSLGCIMAELVTKDILFKGMKELEQIDAIFKIMGTPTEKSWPGLSKLPACSQIKFPKYKPTLRKVILEATGYNSDSLLTEAGFDLLERLLCLDPAKRISATEALEHPWFKELPFPKNDALMPTFAESKNRDGQARPPRDQRRGGAYHL